MHPFIIGLFASVAFLAAIFTTPKAFGHHDTGINEPRSAVHRIAVGEDGSCSGVMISAGLMLTAKHCLDGGPIVLDGKPTRILAVGDEPSDVAVLVVDKGCPCVPVAFATPPASTHVYVIGFPYYGVGEGLYSIQIVTEGTVQGYLKNGYMALTAPVAPGNSGGGVFVRDSGGRWHLVGITSAFVGQALHLSLAASVPQIWQLLNKKTK